MTDTTRKCTHCGRALDDAILPYFSASKKCCSKECKRAEDKKLATTPKPRTVDNMAEWEANA